MLIRGDARRLPLRDGCVDCVVTSPPYFALRNYGHPGQIGLEASPDDYVEMLAAVVFDELRRVLKSDGTVWLNVGDSYNSGTQFNHHSAGLTSGARYSEGARGDWPGHRPKIMGLKTKDLVGIPWMLAFALRARGWYLRSDIIWSKPNPMPESVTDRPTKAHEYLFLLSKSERYYYDAAAIAEPVSAAMLQEVAQGYEGFGLKDYDAAGVQNPSSVKARIITNARRKNEQSGDRRKVGFNDRWDEKERLQTYGKPATTGPQAAGRRIVENVAIARANGGPHDSPFGVTRNKRTVWTVNTQPYAGAHFATMPEALVEPCILAGCPLGGLVLDPFVGSGTVVAVAQRLGRRGVGVDLSYQDLAKARTAQQGIPFGADVCAGTS